ncbi:hypothetical protein P170DRAFT_509316 [Aspergillus steynii IBT 23096]|uniref:MYND-type domain-containing protein n=1 Tax=Aspergillus steynii IBT 23096 TaxID=1392250 RepID=A0A2I2GEI9_9EURO|nr:uncharacterized protein P170DRAFT_509316 [Aspergillus steynii IBT 23096]PLB51316.1 hypothetical protein P170DRAFT_509316 [Aspergillus steynii IBT 23096]
MSSTLDIIEGCSLCNRPITSHECQGCQVVSYCSPEHLHQHQPIHQEACDPISRARRETELYNLRDEDGNIITPQEVDVRERGWRFRSDNFRYAASRLGWVEALEHLHTRKALEAQLEHLIEAAHLFQNDEENKTGILRLLFRLGRHAEFYSLAKSRITADWGQPLQSWVATRENSSDPFEDSKWLLDNEFEIDTALLLLLLKVNMLHDLVALNAAAVTAGPKVPQEILDHICSYVLTTSIIANERKAFFGNENTEHIGKLRAQIKELYGVISRKRPDAWNLVIGNKAGELPEQATAPVNLGHIYSLDVWNANRWAIEYISKLRESCP